MAKATTFRGKKPAESKPKIKTEPSNGAFVKRKQQTPVKGKKEPFVKKEGGNKSEFQKKEYSKKDTASAAHGVQPGNAMLSLVTRMETKSLSWYQAVKPLKQQEKAPEGGKKRKTKKPEPPAAATGLDDALVQAKKTQAQRLLAQEVARFDAKKSGKMSSDDKYLSTMMQKGTLADRVAALTLTIQSSPFHTLSRLSQLITMASKKARRESMMAVESLKDLFINNLLPDDRKLNFFHQNPLDHPDVTDEHLVVWFYEHCLKTAFAQLVGVLSSGMNDAVDNHKRACIRAANALLAAKPEQEAVLLGMLVNKIGDPDRKIASYIHKTLKELLQEHPVMKRVVVDEVERVLTRPKVSERAKYNAVLFLNQIILRKDDDDDAALASHLITVYFGLFSQEVHAVEEQEKADKLKQKTKKKYKNTSADASSSSMDRKLLSALLVGVNRAFPYAKGATSADLQKEIDTLFKVVRLAKHFTTGVQALMLLFQVMHATNSVSDRFYTSLYEKLLDPKLRETSKHTLFLNLVFKAMKADVSPTRTSALFKRLLQLTSVMSPAFTCAVLFLLSEVLKAKPQLRTLLDQPESGSGDANGDDERFEDQDTVVFDPSELEKEDDDDDDSEAGEEDAEDAATDGMTDAERSQRVLAEMFGDAAMAEPTAGSRKALSFEEDPKPSDKMNQDKTETSYNWQKRNPLYAGAETSCAWELHHLLTHYHPSVQMFARQLVSPTGIQYAGDPLVDFTLHAFFEKFMNKKPRYKQPVAKKVNPLAEDDGRVSMSSWTSAAINSEALLDKAPESVDVSDQFFYKFFQERAAREATHPTRKHQKKKAKSDEDRDGDAFSDDDDAEEDEEMEAFAQQLAEGIMQDGDMDEEDPEMDDWSGPEDDDDEGDDGGELELDDEAMAFGDDDDEDDEPQDLDDDDDEGDDDDEDDGEGFDFGAMDDDMDDDDEEEEEEEPKKKGKQPPKPQRKSFFASADDYDTIVQQALAQQKHRKRPGADSKANNSKPPKKSRRH
ncbi:hypothetical protein Poli38472_012738 [Pythium oligandrum]|uniref:CCAAT-binding factor domain-containing protein n=1 Tax=Pythium oligandrum TaxID=41045 RepID=A0A8K1FJ91_PYTOL|nr:hypothetical protein Poli38472_012738 [Pythium oligandrum]|eukprot:TMW61547.1 hypothetical protein Poli38472_012738 [Pythium oligandrum]